MRFLKLATSQLFAEGRRIFPHVIIEKTNIRPIQYLQHMNKNLIHVTSPRIITPKREGPEIHLNDGYAHRPNISRVAAGSIIFLDKQFWCPILIGRYLAVTRKYIE